MYKGTSRSYGRTAGEKVGEQIARDDLGRQPRGQALVLVKRQFYFNSPKRCYFSS
jgi:hypothetical protein